MTRLVVTGSRDWTDRAVVEEALTLADRLASPALSPPLDTAAGAR